MNDLDQLMSQEFGMAYDDLDQLMSAPLKIISHRLSMLRDKIRMLENEIEIKDKIIQNLDVAAIVIDLEG